MILDDLQHAQATGDSRCRGGAGRRCTGRVREGRRESCRRPVRRPRHRPSAGSATAAAPTTAAPAGGVIAKTSDVPVGSGVIVGEVVVTQPVAGEFNGLLGEMHAQGLHGEQGGRRNDRLPVPRQQVQPGRNGRQRSGDETAGEQGHLGGGRFNRAGVITPAATQVELTPGIRPSRNASTKCRWSSRTVAAYSRPKATISSTKSSDFLPITSTMASSVWKSTSF